MPRGRGAKSVRIVFYGLERKKRLIEHIASYIHDHHDHSFSESRLLNDIVTEQALLREAKRHGVPIPDDLDGDASTDAGPEGG